MRLDNCRRCGGDAYSPSSSSTASWHSFAIYILFKCRLNAKRRKKCERAHFSIVKVMKIFLVSMLSTQMNDNSNENNSTYKINTQCHDEKWQILEQHSSINNNSLQCKLNAENAKEKTFQSRKSFMIIFRQLCVAT